MEQATLIHWRIVYSCLRSDGGAEQRDRDRVAHKT